MLKEKVIDVVCYASLKGVQTRIIFIIYAKRPFPGSSPSCSVHLGFFVFQTYTTHCDNLTVTAREIRRTEDGHHQPVEG